MMGPLSTFSSRILIAYHLGWLRSEQKAKLDAFRKLRNEFAHRAFKVSITDESMKALVDNLGKNFPTFIASIHHPDAHNLKCIDELLCKLVFLAHLTFTDLLVLPAAIRFQVSPRDIAPSFDEQPELLKNMARAISRALLLSGAISPQTERSSGH
jgi:hypothetical protein